MNCITFITKIVIQFSLLQNSWTDSHQSSQNFHFMKFRLVIRPDYRRRYTVGHKFGWFGHDDTRSANNWHRHLMLLAHTTNRRQPSTMPVLCLQYFWEFLCLWLCSLTEHCHGLWITKKPVTVLPEPQLKSVKFAFKCRLLNAKTWQQSPFCYALQQLAKNVLFAKTVWLMKSRNLLCN